MKRGSNTSQAYELLKKKIITLQIRPGEYLDEKGLMKEPKIGRTPLREAILLLKNEKLIEGQPNKPSFVKEITFKGVKDIMETLLIVERDVTCLAAQRIGSQQIGELKIIQTRIEKAIESRDSWEITSRNLDFHFLISSASDNEFFSQFHRITRNAAERLSYFSVSHEIQGTSSLESHIDSISREHQELLSALEAHDVSRTEALSIEHTKHFQDRILNYLKCDQAIPFQGMTQSQKTKDSPVEVSYESH